MSPLFFPFSFPFTCFLFFFFFSPSLFIFLSLFLHLPFPYPFFLPSTSMGSYTWPLWGSLACISMTLGAGVEQRWEGLPDSQWYVANTSLFKFKIPQGLEGLNKSTFKRTRWELWIALPFSLWVWLADHGFYGFGSSPSYCHPCLCSPLTKLLRNTHRMRQLGGAGE